MAAAADVGWHWAPAAAGDAVVLHPGGGADGMVKALAVTSDGAVFAGFESGALRAYRSTGGVSRVLLGHDGPVLCLLVHGGALWSGGHDRRLKAWSLAPGHGVGGWGSWIRTIKGHHAAVKALFAGEPGRVWSLGEDRTLRLWRCSDGALLLLIRSSEHLMLCAAFGGGAHPYAACAEGAAVSVYRASDGKRTAQLQGHAGVVWALLARGDELYTGGDDGTVRAWRRTGACTRIMRGHKRCVTALALSPGDSSAALFSASGDGTVRAWRTDASGECLLIVLTGGGALRSLALAHDGSLLFAGGVDGLVRQYAAADGGLLCQHGGHESGVHLLALSPTGQLWSGGYDGDVRGWLVMPPHAWSRGNHCLWPPPFRAAVRAFLCAVARPGCAAHSLALGGPTQAGLIDAVVRATASTIRRLPHSGDARGR
jgi:WD40 repeat protein